MKLLVLSNGHGEDIIATRILKQLRSLAPELELAALPIVGEGYAYSKLNIPLAGRVQQMPSGGFIYMGGNPLWEDLRGGLLKLTLEQIKIVRHWGKSGGMVLAVGDIVPLLYAWFGGGDYAFVGTAKSEYYLRDEQGWLAQTSRLERYFGSVYLPWDCWLASRQRCKAIFPRDSLTTKILQQRSLAAYDLGNPMMDGIAGDGGEMREMGEMGEMGEIGEMGKIGEIKRLLILLLPGSRMPEAFRNWQQIIAAIESVIDILGGEQLQFLAAIAPALDIQPFSAYLQTQGWNFTSSSTASGLKAMTCTKEQARLTLTINAGDRCLHQADIAISMAGTATEQLVGLGKPVITMAGAGPQFTYAFAEAQTRLLGCSVILVDSPQQVGMAIASVINNPQRLQKIAANGKRRMGESGAAQRIARCLQTTLLGIH